MTWLKNEEELEKLEAEIKILRPLAKHCKIKDRELKNKEAIVQEFYN